MGKRSETVVEFERIAGMCVNDFAAQTGFNRCQVYRHIAAGYCNFPKKDNSGGKKHHPYYKKWQSMIERCYNPHNKRYAVYGGRGIRVCARWFYDFWDFVEDIGDPPGPGHSMDRRDPNGNYEPSNVRWASFSEQSRNRTRVERDLPFGVTKRKRNGKYSARLTPEPGKRVVLGEFSTPEEAEQAHRTAYNTRFGEYPPCRK